MLPVEPYSAVLLGGTNTKYDRNLLEKTNELFFLMQTYLSDTDVGSGASLVTGLPPAPVRLSQSLPLRGMETELQKQLAEERKLSEQHRQNYERLKIQHSKLQEENVKIRNEYCEKAEENKLLFKQLKSDQEQFKKNLLAKDEELSNFRSKVVTPQQVELMRLECYSEVENVYKDRLQKLEQELEVFKNCCNRQRYELTLMETKCDQEAVQHKMSMQELKKKLETEVNNVRAEKEHLLSQTQSESLKDSEQILILKRENVNLHEQIKTALTELEEMRAQREKANLEVDQVKRLLTKNETEFATNIKNLQHSNESLLKENKKLQEEITEIEHIQTTLSNEKHEIDQKNIVLKKQVDQLIQQHKLEIKELKMNLTKKHGEIERECDRLTNYVKDLKSHLEVAEEKSKQQAESLLEKKREVSRQIQIIREKEMLKQNQVEAEKLELEAKLQEIYRKKSEEETTWQKEKEYLDDKLKEALDTTAQLEKELLVLRTKLEQERSMKEELEQEKSENGSLRCQINSLQLELNTLQSGEREMSNKFMRLRNSMEKYRNEAKRLQEQLAKADQCSDELLSRQKMMWKENVDALEVQSQELKKKCNEGERKISMAANIHLKYKQRSLKAIRALKKQLELKSAKNEELEASRKVLENWIPPEEHKKLKHQMRDMIRRHNEFRRVIFCSNPFVITDASFASVPNATLNSELFDEQEERHQKELTQLKRRLDKLDNVQKEHFEELQNIMSSTPHEISVRTEEKADSEKS